MIIHVDMDAFYASVEQRDAPQLVGQPVVVGGSSKGRGVVSAASYEARKFGIHSAMSAAQAIRLCPHAVFVRPRIGYYAQVSQQIREIFERYTPIIEPLSLDEAFLDVTGSQRLFGAATEIGKAIQSAVRTELNLRASVGVAPNKFLAKVASDLRKPNGFVVVEPNQIEDFLSPLPIGAIWGIGKVTSQTLRRLSIQTIGQLRQLPASAITELFGSSGDHYSKLARGIDDRPVVPDREAKSISNETTFSEDIADYDILRTWLVSLVEQVSRRLRNHGHKAKTVELKVRYSDFKTISRSLTLTEPTDMTQSLLDAGLKIFNERLPTSHLSIRLLGFGVHNIDPSGVTQLTLFDEQERHRDRSLDNVADQIATKFGSSAIHRASARGRKKPASENDSRQ